MIENRNTPSIIVGHYLLDQSIEVRGNALVYKVKNKEVVIPMSSVSGVELKAAASKLRVGLITIKLNKAPDTFINLGGGIISGNSNDISIAFYPEFNNRAKKLRDFIINYNPAQSTVNSSFSVADEIKKLKSLLDDGILTQQEFEAKKKQLLNL